MGGGLVSAVCILGAIPDASLLLGSLVGFFLPFPPLILIFRRDFSPGESFWGPQVARRKKGKHRNSAGGHLGPMMDGLMGLEALS
jgi:hypothetical protein